MVRKMSWFEREREGERLGLGRWKKVKSMTNFSTHNNDLRQWRRVAERILPKGKRKDDNRVGELGGDWCGKLGDFSRVCNSKWQG